MKLSVVIVNYNVKFFLEQCLLSVRKAAEHLKSFDSNYLTEIILVDNNSVDGSTDMIHNKFPDVILIKNFDNKGFSYANNQAIHKSKGEFVLLLNPDTVIEESTFVKVIGFMDDTADAGALGVKMIDGKGNYLPESKRSLPTPTIAFYKIFGLSKVFPNSKKFGKYHLSYLDKDNLHEVDILSGAFMLIRKSVLEKIGYLDERFFMYGEDIDLSYRIKQSGYKNYYFPFTQIIHYKGESTKRSSVNYVFIFYRAMTLFAKKHFTYKQAFLFSSLINIAIYIRASISIIRRYIQKILLPLVDWLLIFLGLILIKVFWEKNEIIGHRGQYPPELIYFIFPIYALLWVLGLFFSKGYFKPYSYLKIFRGVIIGSILISILYAFLSDELRFSRAIIIMGTIMAFVLFSLSRLIYQYLKSGDFKIYYPKDIRIAIIGSEKEYSRVFQLLNNSNIQPDFIGYISTEKQISQNPINYLGQIGQLDEIIEIHKITELIFCAKDLPSSKIIYHMTNINKKGIIYKIAPEESLFIIGSNHRNEPGDLYTLDIKLSISSPENVLYKTLLDLVFVVLFIVFSPLLFPIQFEKTDYFQNIFSVLRQKMTFVGYHPENNNSHLPKLKKCILSPFDLYKNILTTHIMTKELNFIYARDYSPLTDIKIILLNLRYLGRKTSTEK